MLVDAAAAATPKLHNSSVNVTNYLSKVQQMVRQRRKVRDRWQQTSRSPECKMSFNQLNKETKELIWSIDHLLTTLDATKDTNHSLWRISKASKKPPGYVPPLRKCNKKWARSDQEKADTLADHLEATFQPNDIESDVTPIIEQNDGPIIGHITPGAVKAVIKTLKNRKASGTDLGNTEILKNLPKKGIVTLT